VYTKSIKDRIEGMLDMVLNIGNVLNRGGATNLLPCNHITVPYMLEGKLVVLLAHRNLVDRIFKLTDELMMMF